MALFASKKRASTARGTCQNITCETSVKLSSSKILPLTPNHASIFHNGHAEYKRDFMYHIGSGASLLLNCNLQK